MAYDYQKALDSGASEDQVLEYLNKTRGYNVQGALSSGASKTQVIDYLSKTNKPNFAVATETPKEDTLYGKIINNPVTRGIQAFFPGKKVGGAIGTLGALTKANFQGQGEFVDTSAPTPLQTVGDVAQGALTVGGFKLPPAATVAGRLGQSAALGGGLSGSGAISGGENLSDVAKETVKGAITGLAIQGIFEAVPAISKLVGDKSKNISAKLREKNLRLSPLQKEKLNSKIGDVTDYLSKNKVTGNPESQYKFMSDKYDDVENRVQGLLKNSGKNYSKADVIRLAKDIPDNYATEFDNPEVYDQLVSKSEKFANYINKNFANDIPATKLNQFKRSYMKNGYNKAGDAISNEASLAIGDSLYSKLLKDIPELNKINKEYSTVIIGKKILGKALGRNELGLMGNLVSSAGGAIVGGAVGGPVGSATGAIVGPKLGKVVGGTAARTQYAVALEKVSQILKKASGSASVSIPRTLLIGLMNKD